MTRIIITLLAGIVFTAPAWAEPPAGKRGGELRKDTQEIRQDRRELRDDKRELRQDMREGDREAVRDGREELREDREELREDMKERREDMREKMGKMREACKSGEKKACEAMRRQEMMMHRKHERGMEHSKSKPEPVAPQKTSK